jgi:superfamily II DNA or RNA helicase
LARENESELSRVLGTLKGRGRGFEELSAWFLRNDPEWAPRITQVWLWNDWPGRWGPDRGIDLIAETDAGDLLAVQCKHYATSQSVAKADIDSFLSESNRNQFAERLLIATTNALSSGAHQVIAAQEKPVSLILRDRLEQAPVDWSRFSIAGPAQHFKKSPLPHQSRAIEAVLAGFEEGDRGRLLMPCGTGKTLTSLWIAEGAHAQRTLILVPTLDLVRQTALVWRAEAEGPFALLKVCSERSVENDEVARADLTPAEVGSATTDPSTIATFLAAGGKRVLVSTYDSSPRIAEALSRLPGAKFDLVICDEAHHCTGIEGRARRTVLDDARIPARRRLFATATPAVFSAPARDHARELQIRVASMDDQRRFGPVFHRLSFKGATEKGLLCPFRVLVMPILDTEVAELVRRRRLVTADEGAHVTDAYNLAAQIACLRTMSRYGCRRLVAFQPGVEDSRRFVEDLDRAAQLLDADEAPAGLQAAHIDGYMSKGRRQEILNRFTTDDEPHLLSNVRLLAEGVDVPGIDSICLIDTNRGPASVVQAVGRAVRRAPGKKFGTVLLPLLVSAGQSPEDALRHSVHRPVLQVLAALRSLDSEIVSSIEGFRTELGPSRGRGTEATSHWIVDGPESVGREFGEAVEVCLVEALGGDRPRPPKVIEDHAPDEAPRPGEGTVSWSSEEIVDVGLEWAERHHIERLGPVDLQRTYNGFPFERWGKIVLRRWEKGRLSDDQRRRCAVYFNWLEISPKKHPTVRRDLAELDAVPLYERVDQWLDRYGPSRGDAELDKFVRAGYIGNPLGISSRGLSSRGILELIPSSLPAGQRLVLALAALKIGGRALSDTDGSEVVAQGFRECLAQPDRGHGLEGGWVRGRSPQGDVQAHEFGWNAGEEAIRLIENRVGKVRVATAPARRKHHRRGKNQRSMRSAA